MMKKTKYFNNLKDVEALSVDQQESLQEVTEKYRFRSNDYYLSLINWDDPDDPIRRLIVPHESELEVWGSFDPSQEHFFTIIPGLEHKYQSTALLLVSNVCGGICRYCFRKRVFISKHGDTLQDLPKAIEYISEHTEITNVLLTGGDPLMLSTGRLKKIIHALMEIEHVKVIRLGTKMLAFDPNRVLDDPELCDLIKSCVDSGKQIYMMTHFNHVREITDLAIKAVKTMHHTGAVLCNQTPMIHGVNDTPEILAELFQELSVIGVPPYYVFQCRPASGNKDYAVGVERGYKVFEEAKNRVSGLAKRARFIMSHETGKIEVVGLADGKIYFKYHQMAERKTADDFMVFQSNPNAYWFDDYEEPVKDHYYKSYGPE